MTNLSVMIYFRVWRLSALLSGLFEHLALAMLCREKEKRWWKIDNGEEISPHDYVVNLEGFLEEEENIFLIAQNRITTEEREKRKERRRDKELLR